MVKKKHNKKDVNAAIREAESSGWVYEASGNNHKVGYLMCSWYAKNGKPNTDCNNGKHCRQSVYGSPKNQSIAAKVIRKNCGKCNINKTQNDQNNEDDVK